MNLSAEDFQAIALTLQLASVTTALLLLLATPVAWWLAHTRSAWRAPVASLVALPLVLPPTVLGFYLLIALGPNGPIGQFRNGRVGAPWPLAFGAWCWAQSFTRCRLQCSRW
jgi:molybdate transport system permease protein